MKTELMRHFAVALGLGAFAFISNASGQGAVYPPQTHAYSVANTTPAAQQSPSTANQVWNVQTSMPSASQTVNSNTARWNQYRPNTPQRLPVAGNQYSSAFRTVAMQNRPEELPTPQGHPDPLSSAISSQPAQPHAVQPHVAPEQAPSPAYSHTSMETPVYHTQHQPVMNPMPVAAPTPVAATGDCQSCQSGAQASQFQAAVSAPWPTTSYECAPPVAIAGPQPISPWFGGLDLLFWDYSESGKHTLVSNDAGMPRITTRHLRADNTLGFDVRFGRYFGCGAYGLEFSYLNWDPDSISLQAFDTGAGIRLTHPGLRDLTIARTGYTGLVYDDYDTNATRIRADRDIDVQGIEVNLVTFGLMGARRLGSCQPNSLIGGGFGLNLGRGGYGSCNSCATGCDPCGGCAPSCGPSCRPARFFGGAGGPIARACSGRVRVQNSHGFRWFQFNDDLRIVGDVDGTSGYSATDLWYDVRTENNLYGYQYGSRLTYCMGCRLLLNIGGKIGIYGNDVSYRQRIGTGAALAYTNSQGVGVGDVYTEEHDAVLSTLGELDLGAGYRLSNRCTVRGGYRILGASGIATSVGHLAPEYSTVESSSYVRADDSLILHGAYVGFDYNW